MLPRAGDKGTARVTFQQFLVAGALSALDVIDCVMYVRACLHVCEGGHPFAVKVCAVTQTEVVRFGISAVASFEGCQSDCVGVRQSHSPRELHPDKNTPATHRRRRVYPVFTICFAMKLDREVSFSLRVKSAN